MPTRAESLIELQEYVVRMRAAVAADQHHDQRRQILTELLLHGFDLTIDTIQLERNVRVERTRGRIDLLYGAIAWEVKRDLDRERLDLERELKLYLTDLGTSAFGVATDGLRFEVYQLDAAGELRRIDAYDLDAPTATLDEALDWLDAYVFALEQVSATTESILERFGLTSAVYHTAEGQLREMWRAIADEQDAAVKHDEWARLLEVVYGTHVGDEELWLRHTYLVMVARLLAYLVIVEALPRQGEELGALTGELFTPLGLQNLVEHDFFAWPAIPEIADQARSFLRRLANHLGLFSLGSIDEDLLKELYEQMVDPAERDWLGEFYTPDWLADFTLERAGFDRHKRMLDPSCGSGTFLFAAIRRLRRYGLRGAELVRTARRNVIGLELHPLAVTFARANYVLALRGDLRESDEALVIPVFMADTLAAPEAGFGRAVLIKAPTDGLPAGLPQMFELPTERDEGQTASVREIVELVDDLSDPGLDADQAETGLRARLESWGVRSHVQSWEENLRLLRALRANHRDTIWSFVLTNAARPNELAADPVDLVVGNPPWLTVMEMAGSEYKNRVKRSAREFRLVGGGASSMADVSHIDTSTVFASFCASHFLRQVGGRVAFVLPRSVMAGARQHKNFREGRAALWYAPVAAIDLYEVEPLFRIPACVMIFDNVAEADKPPPPWSWPTTAMRGQLPRKNASRAEADESLSEETVDDVTTEATPSPYLADTHQGVDIRPRAFWTVEPDPVARVLDRTRPYLRSDTQAVERADARAGWRGVSIAGRIEARYLYATSLRVDPYRIGRLRLVAMPIETADGGVRVLSREDVLTRGDTGFATWLARADEKFKEVREAHDRTSRLNVIEYLNTQRKLSYQRPEAPRVVWGKGGTYIRAAVIPADIDEVHGLPVQGFIIDLNQYVVTCASLTEAHYLCAMLNSNVVNEGIRSEQTFGQFGARDIHRRPVEFVPIPRFDGTDAEHQRLAELSVNAHARARGIEFDSQRNRDRYMAAVGDAGEQVHELARRVLARGA
jgi:hypothetical protein